MEKLKELMNENQTVVSFDDSEIERLAEVAELIELPQEQILFSMHDVSDSAYLVISGSVDLFTCLQNNLEQTIFTVRSGGFIDAYAMIEEGSRDINARVAEHTQAFRFDRNKVHSLIAVEKGLGIKLLRLLADILSKRLHIAISSLRQNLEWTIQVSGLASLDISQMIVDRVDLTIELTNGKQLTGVIMKAEERPSGIELFLKTGDGRIHFIPYHGIVSASLNVDSIKTDQNESSVDEVNNG